MIEHIGGGAMGVVWRARDERLERMIAIKQLVLQPGLSARESDEARQRALREARIAARLHHPNAVTIFDVAEYDGEPCLVMEYVSAPNLGKIITEQGTLTPQTAAAIGAQVASALATAHAVGIVHRDVKPGNILLTSEGIAKITDFGISRAIGDVTVTQTGFSAGTPAYLAPEVARGHDPSPTADVFSLGATLYHAVEGMPPFGGNQNALALLHAVAVGDIKPPRKAGPLTPLLLSLLDLEPERRPTMAQAAEALSAVAAGAPSLAVTAPSGTRVLPAATFPAPTSQLAELSQQAFDSSGRPNKKSKPSRRVLVATMVGLLLVAAIAMFAVTRLFPSENAATSPIAPSTHSAPVSSSQQTTTSTATSSPIAWAAAGQLVIDYYNSFSDLPAAWAKLSPELQGQFGNIGAFTAYWHQYRDVSARNAFGVTVNSDGSVNVPVDVTYTDGNGDKTTHKVIRVIQRNGQLLIDSDGK